MDKRLLVVEDELHLAKGLKLNLELEGYSVTLAKNAREAGAALLNERSFDAIILDVMLPDMDGFIFCQRLRKAKNYTPVLMLTARSNPSDRVTGLESGADDYLVKPFSIDELQARIGSMLRRRSWEEENTQDEARTLSFAGANINFNTHECLVRGEIVTLTPLEMKLLAYFGTNPGRVISRQELLTRVWESSENASTRTVDNFIGRLRKHFEIDPSSPTHFISLRGAGYKFVPGT